MRWIVIIAGRTTYTEAWFHTEGDARAAFHGAKLRGRQTATLRRRTPIPGCPGLGTDSFIDERRAA